MAFFASYQVPCVCYHSEQRVMVFEHVDLQQMGGRKGPLTLLTAVTVKAVIVSFIAETTLIIFN